MTRRRDSISKVQTANRESAARLEIHDLRLRLEEAQETLAAIRRGEIDALIVNEDDGQRVYTLQTADRPYRLFLERMQQGAVTLDQSGTILYCNNRFAHMVRTPPSEVVGKYLKDFLVPSARQVLESLVRHSDEGTGEAEIDLLGADSVPITTLVSASPLVDEHGIRTTCLVITDLTEQKYHAKLLDAQNALRSSEEEYRATFELSGVGKAQIEPTTGLFHRVNNRFCQMVGYSADELIGMSAVDVIHPEDRQDVADMLGRLLRGDSNGFEREIRYLRRDGSIVWGDVTANLIFNLSGRPLRIVAVIQDVTNRKSVENELERHQQELESLVQQRTEQLEQSHVRLRSSERMVALGTLSAGLGHDMGNLLLPVRLRLDALESSPSLAPDSAAHIKAIRDCIEYMQRLSNGLRMFAQDPHGAASLDDGTNLRVWWPDVEPFFRHALPRSIMLEHSLADGIPAVCLSRQSLTQAVYNLVQNAGDAMKGMNRGRVRVWAHAVPDGQTVQIGVEDDGPGMTTEVRRHCLEPFFTTKCRDISTGLGLSIVHGIVQRAGGTVEVESEPGRGARFILNLPSGMGRREVRESLQPSHRAVVCIQNPRRASYVTSVLQSMSFHVMPADDPQAQAALLWVSDSVEQAMQWSSPNGEKDHGRYVVLLGSQSFNGASHERLIELGEEPKLSQMRRRFQEIASQLENAAAAQI